MTQSGIVPDSVSVVTMQPIECFLDPGKAPIEGEVLKKQEQLYHDLGVAPLLATSDQE